LCVKIERENVLGELRERAEAGAFYFEAMKSLKIKRGIAVKCERARKESSANFRGLPFGNPLKFLNDRDENLYYAF
jgi:hypothetical protein